MGAGVFLTRHREILAMAFGTPNQYMPREATGLPVEDNFGRSMQWSRRFIGLKIFLALYVAGWDGIREMLRHTIRMGDLLRQRLAESGWTILNETPLPVVCFTAAAYRTEKLGEHLQAILSELLASGEAWISSTVLAGTQPALRACITNYRTQPEDVEALIRSLDSARRTIANG
jgi:glutamate/tyrosine decarboxylase-like PLP-dependent enzyme